MYCTKTIVPRFNLLLPSSRTIVITYELHMVAKGCVFIYIVGIARLTNRITSATCVVLHYFIYEPNDSFVLITIIRMPSDSVRSIGMLILYALFSSSKLIALDVLVAGWVRVLPTPVASTPHREGK